MPTKSQTKYTCQQCGAESTKWLGRCLDCGAWNSYVETAAPQTPAKGGLRIGYSAGNRAVEPASLAEVRPIQHRRIHTGFEEFDRVLGDGIVPGSLVLIGGEPGIGKSTLLLQLSGKIAEQHGPVLYVSAEESAEQVKMRADRLGISSDRLYLLAEIDIDVILDTAVQLKPSLVIVDSIQTIATSEVSSVPGSVSQVRECTMRLMQIAKSQHLPIFIIGHVTKEGTVAGPRALEHIVDAVLYLEGERYHTYRLLRGVKNRFGATNEIGVFEMQGDGLQEVQNPSAIFLAERGANSSGSAVVVSMEGTRPLLVEVQALASTTSFGMPRCTATGVDHNRLLMLMAVLTKRVGLALGNQDVYVNVVGGFTLDEPAVDLGIALAIASSYRERPIAAETALIGEVGLSGELRPVSRTGLRIQEASKLGFRQCIIPQSGKIEEAASKNTKMNMIRVRTLAEALEAGLS